MLRLISKIEHKVGKVGLQVQFCALFQETGGHIIPFSKQMVWIGTLVEVGTSWIFTYIKISLRASS